MENNFWFIILIFVCGYITGNGFNIGDPETVKYVEQSYADHYNIIELLSNVVDEQKVIIEECTSFINGLDS